MFFKPGWLWVHAWFTKIISEKVCIYLSLSVRTDPREQTILVAKATLLQEV